MRLEDVVKLDEVTSPTTQSTDGEVEKLAEVLEALAEEDTLLDDLARAAVAFEMVEKHYGQKSNA